MAHTENMLKLLKMENRIALVLNLQNDRDKVGKILRMFGYFI